MNPIPRIIYQFDALAHPHADILQRVTDYMVAYHRHMRAMQRFTERHGMSHEVFEDEGHVKAFIPNYDSPLFRPELWARTKHKGGFGVIGKDSYGVERKGTIVGVVPKKSSTGLIQELSEIHKTYPTESSGALTAKIFGLVDELEHTGEDQNVRGISGSAYDTGYYIQTSNGSAFARISRLIVFDERTQIKPPSKAGDDRSDIVMCPIESILFSVPYQVTCKERFNPLPHLEEVPGQRNAIAVWEAAEKKYRERTKMPVRFIDQGDTRE